jgi:hypothetical protein
MKAKMQIARKVRRLRKLPTDIGPFSSTVAVLSGRSLRVFRQQQSSLHLQPHQTFLSMLPEEGPPFVLIHRCALGHNPDVPSGSTA